MMLKKIVALLSGRNTVIFFETRPSDKMVFCHNYPNGFFMIDVGFLIVCAKGRLIEAGLPLTKFWIGVVCQGSGKRILFWLLVYSISSYEMYFLDFFILYTYGRKIFSIWKLFFATQFGLTCSNQIFFLAVDSFYITLEAQSAFTQRSCLIYTFSLSHDYRSLYHSYPQTQFSLNETSPILLH